jgi:hypothetical protein
MTETQNNETILETKTTMEKEDLIYEDTSFLMKRGDYTVHVLIEEVKNIVTKTLDRPRPCVKISCLNQCKRVSKPEEDCEQYTYNEHVYFTETDLSVEVLDSAKIIIEVYDYHNSKREYYIGIQEFDF